MKLVFILLCLITGFQVVGQDVSKASSTFSVMANYDFPESYGASAGITVTKNNLTNTRNKKTLKQLFYSLEINAFHYPFYSTYYSATIGAGLRKTRSDRFHTEISLYTGLLRTVYDGKVYTTDENGNVKEVPFSGRYYVITGANYSYNWQLKTIDHGLYALLRPSLWLQYPYNSFVKIHATIQAGFKYMLLSKSRSYEKSIRN